MCNYPPYLSPEISNSYLKLSMSKLNFWFPTCLLTYSSYGVPQLRKGITIHSPQNTQNTCVSFYLSHTPYPIYQHVLTTLPSECVSIWPLLPLPLLPILLQTTIIISYLKYAMVPQLMSLPPFLPYNLGFPGPPVPFIPCKHTPIPHPSCQHSLCPQPACHCHPTTCSSRPTLSLEEAQPGR